MMRRFDVLLAVTVIVAPGAIGARGGLSAAAVILMALGFGLTVIAVGIGLGIAARHNRPLEPESPVLQPATRGTGAPATMPSAALANHGGPVPKASSEAARTTAAAQTVETGGSALTEGLAEPTGIEPADVLLALRKASGLAGTVLGAHLWLHDPATDTVRLVGFSGDPPPEGEPVRVEGSVLGAPLATRTAVLRAATADDDSVADTDRWRYAVPLSSGEVRGVASIDLIAAQPKRAVLNEAAARYRGSLTAALVLHVSRTETAAARALLDAAAVIVRLTDSRSILETALDRALALTDGQSGSIMLLDDDALHIAVSRGLPDHVVAAASLREGEGIAGWVLATKEPLIVEDLEDRGPRARRHGVRSAMAVPITDGDGIVGVLNVGSESFHARFSATHLASLEAMGRIVAIALNNAAAMADSQDLYLDTVKALALALETKDPYSRGSTERVLELTVQLGEALGMSDSELQALRVAALLHDIGMAAAGDLTAAGSRPLTTVERAMLKMHPVIAADVLRQTRALRAAVPIVYHHHEHFDGTGYVAGLSGDAIPLGARVLSVADAYVSMTSPRPYRDAMQPHEALTSVTAAAGSQFDPRVTEALAGLISTSTVEVE